MLDSQYETKPLDGVSIDQIVALLSVSLGERATRSESFWVWKHRQNPFGKSLGTAAYARDTGELVGIRAFMRWEFLGPEGQVLKAVRAVDTATHPAHRRRGIFESLTESALSQLAAQGVAFVFNTPNAKSLPGYLKMGWRSVGSLPVLFKVPNPFTFLGRLWQGATPGAESWTPRDLTFRSWMELEGQFGKSLEGVIESAGKAESRFGLVTRRSLEYFRWKSVAPGIRYHFEPLIANGELRGFGVFRFRSRRNLREVDVVDLVVQDGDPKLVQQLLRQLSPWRLGDHSVAVARPGATKRQVFQRNGYFAVPFLKQQLVCRPVGDAGDSYFKKSFWNLALDEIEIF